MKAGRELDAVISIKVMGIDTVKISEKGWQTLFQDVYDEPGNERALACAKTAPHAICLAALKVLG